MAKAGYCEQCQANVWLREDGGCEHGHPASAVSNVYESVPVAQPPANESETPAPVSKKWRWWILVAVVLAILVIGGVVFAAARPLLSKGASVASEWQTRIADDYPGWKTVAFNVRSFTGSDGSETAYSFGLKPPGRDFSVGVVYLSKDGGKAISQDEVFRPAGRFNDRADSLLDYIDQNYVAEGRDVVAVDSDQTGKVSVQWIKVKAFGPFSSRVGSFDDLEYDEASGTWEVVFSPDGLN